LPREIPAFDREGNPVTGLSFVESAVNIHEVLVPISSVTGAGSVWIIYRFITRPLSRTSVSGSFLHNRDFKKFFAQAKADGLSDEKAYARAQRRLEVKWSNQARAVEEKPGSNDSADLNRY
jgi:hypothetical protein